MVDPSYDLVGHGVVHDIGYDVKINSAHGFPDDGAAFACTVTHQVRLHQIIGLDITVNSQEVFILLAKCLSDLDDGRVDLFGNGLASLKISDLERRDGKLFFQHSGCGHRNPP